MLDTPLMISVYHASLVMEMRKKFILMDFATQMTKMHLGSFWKGRSIFSGPASITGIKNDKVWYKKAIR